MHTHTHTCAQTHTHIHTQIHAHANMHTLIRDVKKEKTERAMGAGRRTRVERVKWNQMTALTFKTGERLQTPQPPFEVQNTAARVVTLTKKKEHIKPVFQNLHWLPVKDHTVHKILSLVYICFRVTAPQYTSSRVDSSP